MPPHHASPASFAIVQSPRSAFAPLLSARSFGAAQSSSPKVAASASAATGLPPSARSLPSARTPLTATPRAVNGFLEINNGQFFTRVVVVLAFMAGLFGPRPREFFVRAPGLSSLASRFQSSLLNVGPRTMRLLNATEAGLLDDWGEPAFEDPSGTCPDYVDYIPEFRSRLRWWWKGRLSSDSVTELFYGSWERYTPLGRYVDELEGGYSSGGGGGVRDPSFPATLESRVQIVGGAAYYARNPHGTAHLTRSPDVARQVAALLPWAAERSIAIPDVDLAFNVLDRPAFTATVPLPAPPHGMSAGFAARGRARARLQLPAVAPGERRGV